MRRYRVALGRLRGRGPERCPFALALRTIALRNRVNTPLSPSCRRRVPRGTGPGQSLAFLPDRKVAKQQHPKPSSKEFPPFSKGARARARHCRSPQQRWSMLEFIFAGTGQDARAKLRALGASQAMIEFSLDGTILTANERFLSAMGYTLAEIQGQHHSLLVDPAYKSSPEYTRFWDALRRGEFQAAEFKRFGKGGREVWLQASYNPVMGGNGKPTKILKVATDITAVKLQTGRLCRPGHRDRQVSGGDRVQDGRHGHRRQPELPRCAGIYA